LLRQWVILLAGLVCVATVTPTALSTPTLDGTLADLSGISDTLVLVSAGDRFEVATSSVFASAGDLVVLGDLVLARGVALDLVSPGRITVLGSILAADAAVSQDGGTIRVLAREILIGSDAVVQAGAGGAGSAASEYPLAIAGAGARGGDIILEAGVIQVEGTLVPGRGGEGGDAIAMAPSIVAPTLAPALAVGGHGGAGGRVLAVGQVLGDLASTNMRALGGRGGDATAIAAALLAPNDGTPLLDVACAQEGDNGDNGQAGNSDTKNGGSPTATGDGGDDVKNG
jgi:hypothetical protein